jgi:hypothetical protein
MNQTLLLHKALFFCVEEVNKIAKANGFIKNNDK